MAVLLLDTYALNKLLHVCKITVISLQIPNVSLRFILFMINFITNLK